MDQRTEINYINRIQKGETNLFSYFLENYSQSVYTLIIRIVNSREDAEELTQDVFLKAFKKLDTYRGDCNFSTWLYRIAYNTAISSVRKRKIIYPAIDENIINSIPDEDVDFLLGESENELLLRKMEAAIEKLDPDEKSIIVLYYLEKVPSEEVSQIFDITQNNLKVKLHRIRKKLFIMIKNEMDK